MPCKLLSCLDDTGNSRSRFCPHCSRYLAPAEYTYHEKLYRNDGIWTKTYLSTKQPLLEHTIWKAMELTCPIPDVDVQTAVLGQQKHSRKVKPFEKVDVSGPLLSVPRVLATQCRLAPIHAVPSTTLDSNNDPGNDHAFQLTHRPGEPAQNVRMNLPHHETVRAVTLTTEAVLLESEVSDKRSSTTEPRCKFPERPTRLSNQHFHSTPMYKSTPKAEGKAQGRPLVTVPKTLSFAPLRVTSMREQSRKHNGLGIQVASLTPARTPQRMKKDRLKPFTVEPQRISELKNRNPRPFSPPPKRVPRCVDNRAQPWISETSIPDAGPGSVDIDFSNITLDDDSLPPCHTTFLGDDHSEYTRAFNCADDRPSISGASSPDRSRCPVDEDSALWSPVEETFGDGDTGDSTPACSNSNLYNTSMLVNVPDSQGFVSAQFASMPPLVDSSVSGVDPSRVPSCAFWTISNPGNDLTLGCSSMRDVSSNTSSDAIPPPTFLKEEADNDSNLVPSGDSGTDTIPPTFLKSQSPSTPAQDQDKVNVSDLSSSTTPLTFLKEQYQFTPTESGTDLLNESTRDFISMPLSDDAVTSPVKSRVETEIATIHTDDNYSIPDLYSREQKYQCSFYDIEQTDDVRGSENVGVFDDQQSQQKQPTTSIDDPESYRMSSNLSLPYVRDDTSYFNDDGTMNVTVDASVSADGSKSRPRAYRVLHRYGPAIVLPSGDNQPHHEHPGIGETEHAASEVKHYVRSADGDAVTADVDYMIPGFSTDIDAAAAKFRLRVRTDSCDVASRDGHNAFSTDVDAAAATAHLRQLYPSGDFSTDIDAVVSGNLTDIEYTSDDSTDIDEMYRAALKATTARVNNADRPDILTATTSANVLPEDGPVSFLHDMCDKNPNFTSQYNIESTRRDTAVFDSPLGPTLRDTSLSRVDATPDQDESYLRRVWRAAMDNDAVTYTYTSFQISGDVNVHGPNATATDEHYTSTPLVDVHSAGQDSHYYDHYGHAQQQEPPSGEVTRFLQDIRDTVARRQAEAVRVPECRCEAYDESRRKFLSGSSRDSVSASPNVTVNLEVQHNYYFDDRAPRGMQLPVVIRTYDDVCGANSDRNESETFHNHVHAVRYAMETVKRDHESRP